MAIVDFPNHQNAGDSLIWLGQKEYLRRLGTNIGYVCDISRYDPRILNDLVPEGPILIQGGGNFGDRWIPMQNFRERVIQDFPDRSIIQLPQSIDFSPGPRLEHAQKILSNHRDLTIFIRDRAGVMMTQELFPNNTVVFCPDLAFGNKPITPTAEPEKEFVFLKRRDSESVHGTNFPGAEHISYIESEWGLTGLRAIQWAILHFPGAVAKRSFYARNTLQPLLAKLYDRQAELNVRNAIGILSRGDKVLTDRLHATVLASLMGKQVLAMDNSNGKVRAIYNDYLCRMPGTTFVDSEVDAKREISKLFGDSA
ncbi:MULTISPECIES: polysaccharide pyruvyl transferase family protein [unclassified Rhodococcus (in: high G+C Gram-positive bacteria)]|uniref:polysaccharide pyruvyl transferase family protein n=1 Tax=unclassified Rhodococcus (in: high G+C Gram-positive bacteria) TaxID=192944 RepID=UPI0012F68BBF|nr:polysaccharide pyruvyl transferase family protein [Rhodococcus sp. DK17]